MAQASFSSCYDCASNSGSPGKILLTRIWIRERSWTPLSLYSSAAFTAPHPAWPSTTNRGVRRCAPAYCRLPITSGEITFPATRTMNNSPKFAKKCSDVPDLPRAFTDLGSILEEATGVNSPPFRSASGESASASTLRPYDLGQHAHMGVVSCLRSPRGDIAHGFSFNLPSP